MRSGSVGRPGIRVLQMIAVGASLMLGAQACTASGPAESPSQWRPALAGGTLRLALVGDKPLKDPSILDPAAPYEPFTSKDAEILRCCLVRTLLSYSGLRTEEGGTELRPDLAAAMPQLSQDRLTWTFRLKEGLRYEPPLDDTEITAADVVRGIARTATVGVSDGTYSAYYSVIQGYDAFARGETDTIPGLEVVNDHTLAVHLTQVTNDLGYRLALPGSAPIPENPRDPTAPYGVAEGHDDGYGPFLIASGPYMVEGADRLEPSKPEEEQPRSLGLTRRSLTLVRNPSWDRSTDDFRGAYVDRIEFRVMEQKEAERRIANGTIDTMFDGLPSAKVIERYLADPELASRVVRENVDLFVGYTAMNLAIPPFDDVHVRRAVNLAYEADRWIRVTNRHWGLGVGSLGHLAPDATEDGLLRDQRPYPFNPAAAKAEMARSSYDENRDGICDHPACKDVFALESDWNGFEKFSDRIWVEDLKAIGITLAISRVGSPHRYADMSLDPTAKVALNLGGFWTADYPNASNLFVTLFRSEGIGGHVYGNESLVGASSRDLKRWGYGVTEVPNVDAEIDRCLSFIGFSQTRCWAGLDQLLMTRVVPWVPQDTLEFTATRSERLVRFPIDQALDAWPALDQVALAQPTE